MARNPRQREPSEQGAPQAYPRTTPPELYPTSDNLYIAHEIGTLKTAVNRLISDVEKQDGKLDTITHTAAFMKGAFWAASGGISILLGIVWYFLDKRLDLIAKAIEPLIKK